MVGPDGVGGELGPPLLDGPRAPHRLGVGLLTQVVAAVIAVVWSFALTYGIGWVLKVTLGWRVSEDAEVGGIDLHQHGETAYETVTQGTVFARESKELRA